MGTVLAAMLLVLAVVGCTAVAVFGDLRAQGWRMALYLVVLVTVPLALSEGATSECRHMAARGDSTAFCGFVERWATWPYAALAVSLVLLAIEYRVKQRSRPTLVDSGRR
jgi:hypothetical protein